MVSTIQVPPDGGFGWVIVFANAYSNFIIIPLLQSFGLIFKGTFLELGLSATKGSLIINLNAAFGMIMGLFNGALLKIFGYRKIAFTAAFLTTIGIVLTSFAESFEGFLFTYGIITSLGFGLNMSAHSLALNSYFRKKKGTAVGYTMTLTGLGPVIMPQVINLLMKVHTVQGTTLILGGIAANTFVAASLLQPAKWHMKTETVEEKKVEEKDEVQQEAEEITETRVKLIRSVSQVESRRQNSIGGSNKSLDDIENVPIYGLDSALAGSVLSLHSTKRKASVVSATWKKCSRHSLAKNQRETVYNPEMTKPIKKKRFIDSVIKFFDLDLLQDPIYVNILIGLSLAIFAEINFSLLTAFILDEFGLTTDQIAIFMSVLGIADIIFRFFAPHIGRFLKLSARPMYLFTLCLLMSTRFSLLISNDFKILLGVSLGLGVAKGIRTVYMSLVIPMYVPIEKLASASGLQMMVNGVCILVGGPVIGIIRDVTGNYTMCIIVLNFITFSTIVLWSMEALVMKLKKKQDAPDDAKTQEHELISKS